jgi:hypothetical protein
LTEQNKYCLALGEDRGLFCCLVESNCLAHESFCLFQGCQMVYFQNKNPNLGKFFEVLATEDVGAFYDHVVYFTTLS